MSVMERILYADRETIEQLLAVWESSVRATHTFLSELDILDLRLPVQDALTQVEYLYCAKETDRIVAFIGVQDRKIEMLFVLPEMRGKGIGKYLVAFALSVLKTEHVDVNEQNEQALGFYKYMGFKTYQRLETDAQDKPFPILQMKLGKA